jgi:hypothetical protein
VSAWGSVGRTTRVNTHPPATGSRFPLANGGHLAERLEQLVAVLLLYRESRGIAAEPAVKPAPGGQERPLP